MSGLSVVSTFQDYTDPVWLGQIGQVTGWQHTLQWPGGPTSAQFNFNTPADPGHRALQQGRLLRAYQGPSLRWTGRLEQPDRTQIPWSCTATGIAALAQDYPAYDTALLDPYNLNSVVDYAITVGLPWTRTASLLTPAGGKAESVGAIFLTDSLSALVQQGNWWYVTPAGAVTTGTTAATGIPYRITPRNPPGRTLGSFITSVTVVYIRSSDHSRHRYFADAPAGTLAKYGRITKIIDLTGVTTGSGGEILQADAEAAGDRLLARYLSQGPAWAGGFTLSRGQAFTINGTPLTDIAEIQPGVTVRVDNVATPGQPTTDVLIGQVDYDADTDTVTLTPFASQKDDMVTALGHVV